jgi:rod shape-determining protein MreD
MRASNFTVYGVIGGSFLIAIILALLPISGTSSWLRPAWVVLVTLYWTIALPARVDIGWAWIIGLLLDGLYGTLLGEHALAFVLTVYLAGLIRRQLLNFSLELQTVVILVLLLIYQVIIYLIQGFAGQVINSWFYWLASFISALLWPVIFLVLRICKQRFNIY